MCTCSESLRYCTIKKCLESERPTWQSHKRLSFKSAIISYNEFFAIEKNLEKLIASVSDLSYR